MFLSSPWAVGKIPCSARFHQQACALKLSGLPVKTSRPAKYTLPTWCSDGVCRQGKDSPMRMLRIVKKWLL